MKSLTNQTILITGAGGGFGQEMVRQLWREGAHLILTDVAGTDLAGKAAALSAELTPGPGRILGHFEADLTTEAGCEAVYADTLSLTPHLDILINNAGIAHFGMFERVPPDRWQKLLQLNLWAPMRLTAHFLPGMLARGSGHIVNVSSMAGVVPTPGLAAYSAAKAGLRAFSEALYEEVRPRGLAVTAIYPFFARTPILDSEDFGRKPKLPDAIIYDPAFVVAELVKGIRQEKLDIFPGLIPRHVSLVRRFAPAALPYLNRWIIKLGAR